MLISPVIAIAKSKPIPDNGTWAGAGNDTLATFRYPVCCPAFAGAKETSTMQLAAESSDASHVVALIANPAVTENLSSEI